MAAIPKAINPRWLDQRRTTLRSTVKEINGQPNPSYERIAAELAEAETEYERREAFVAWVKETLGAIRNEYPLRHGGKKHEERTVFFARDKAKNVTGVWTIAEAWALYESATAAKQE